MRQEQNTHTHPHTRSPSLHLLYNSVDYTLIEAEFTSGNHKFLSRSFGKWALVVDYFKAQCRYNNIHNNNVHLYKNLLKPPREDVHRRKKQIRGKVKNKPVRRLLLLKTVTKLNVKVFVKKKKKKMDCATDVIISDKPINFANNFLWNITVFLL